MDSLLAYVARKERNDLRVVRVDVNQRPDLVERFRIVSAPVLVLVKEGRVVERIEGRASAATIGLMLEKHLSGRSTPSAAV
jgi:thioredoxin 1